MPRIASEFWVKAYLARLRLAGIPAFVTTHGDDVAGTVFVKLNTLDGQARAFERSYDLAGGSRVWVEMTSGAEADVDAALARQRHNDPDAWVIEVESREGRHLLSEAGLSD